MNSKKQQTSSSAKMKWVDRISQLMDSKFTIPGTKIKFGIDPVIGLIPGLGDLGSYGISLALIHAMYQNGASGLLITKMLINASLDAVIGSVPIVGVIFDFWFKANTRNVKLLREHYEEGKHQGSGKGLMILILATTLFLAIGMVFLTVKFLIALIEFIF